VCVETQYTRAADGTNLAFQVTGNGSVRLLFMHSGGIPIDFLADDPGFIRMRKRLGTFSRTAWPDARGMGASEGDRRDSNPGEISDADIAAVLDAVGFTRAALVAEDANGGRAIHFAANHPERVSSLVLINSYAHYVRDAGYPWGIPPSRLDSFEVALKARWGSVNVVAELTPGWNADQRFREWYARSSRFGGGPDQMAVIVRESFEADVRPLLPSLSVPTLVLHREHNRVIHLGASRYLAEHIPNARLIVLPGDAHLFYVGDTDTVVDEIEEFLTGVRSGPEGDVVLAAVLFTDIVASTKQQAERQREWSRLTDRHDAMVRAALLRHQGREVKTIGDGFLAVFNGAGRAMRCAAEIATSAAQMGVEVRAGVHTGEVENRGDDIAGLTVTIAKRVCDLAGPGQVLVSRTAADAVAGSGIGLNDQGEHTLKGIPGTWQTTRLEAAGGDCRSALAASINARSALGESAPTSSTATTGRGRRASAVPRRVRRRAGRRSRGAG
jgi:class 3 adenylate cyclase